MMSFCDEFLDAANWVSLLKISMFRPLLATVRARERLSSLVASWFDVLGVLQKAEVIQEEKLRSTV